jgi:hypothetical protein
MGHGKTDKRPAWIGVTSTQQATSTVAVRLWSAVSPGPGAATAN